MYDYIINIFPHTPIFKFQVNNLTFRSITDQNTFDAMAATQKLYPRGTVKRIVKAHSNRSVSKNADILVRLQVSKVATREVHLADKKLLLYPPDFP